MGTALKDKFHAYVTVRLSEATHNDLVKLAKDDKRTISNYIRMVLENHVDTAIQAQQRPEPDAAAEVVAA